MSSRKSRPLFLFYVLVAYVFLQFGWWSYMLVQLNNDVHSQRRELIVLRAAQNPAADPALVQQQEEELDAKLRKRWLMILGEGVVFLSLLVLGIIRTRSSFRKEAALAEQQKNFLLSVTHELKSPLASARLAHETLLHRELPREKQKELLENALLDIDRLHTLVENILLAARIDNHTYALHQEMGDLSAATSEMCAKAATGLARAHALDAVITQGIHCRFDKLGYPSILLNLVENAVKYSPKGSEISIALVRKGSSAILSVSDCGPGIPDEKKALVFQKFYRLGNEETRQTKGTGLGLYIVKSLADAQGWKLRLYDHTDGGSVFEIEIPNVQNETK